MLISNHVFFLFFQGSVNPPKNLDELLKTTTDININDIDKTINENTWTNKFKTYLEKRNNTEEINSLKFLLKMEAFSKNEQHLKTKKSDPTLLRKRTEMFQQILSAHFNIEENVLALSNNSVSDYLCTWTSDNNIKVSDEDIKYLLEAKKDPTITSEGLEPTYQKFLTQISPSTLACILSII